jgi:phage terminase large subunit-like protein
MSTKTTTSSSAPDRIPTGAQLLDPEWRRRRVEADLAHLPGLKAALVELGLYADLDAEITKCVPPMYVSPQPPRDIRRRYGIYFDVREVARFVEFCRRLRHVKGRWAGHSFIPDLWEIVYVLGPVFGWRQKDGNRYFRELFLEVPRKNGKSTLAAAIALYLLMADSNVAAGRLFESGAEVYAAATTTAQAKNVFRPAEAMARRSPSLSRRLAIRKDEALIYERTVSRFEVISGDPAKAEEKMGGNVSGAIIDETHVHKDRRLIDTIETGTPGREQPLIAHLTTAGSDVEGTIYAEKHDLAIAIAEGKVREIRTWAVVYSVPEDLLERWDDPEVWQVANPGLRISVSVDYLDDAATKARRSEPKRLAFLRLHLNVRTSTVSRWIDLEGYDRGAAFLPVVWPELKGKVGFAGLDLSSSFDLAALAVLIPRWVDDPADPEFEIEVLEVLLRVWTPKDRIGKRAPRERELFARWVKDGHLLTSPGETIDYDAIEDEAYRLADELELDRLSFDRWGSKQIVNHLRDGGLTVAELGQGFAGISAAMKETERIIAEGRLRTGGHPVLRYAFENMAVEMDAAGNIKPNRAKSTGHIDPAVAVVMAADGYARSTYAESVYEERGLATA